MEKHILICGERGVGKSTLIRRLLAESTLPVGGFVTRRLTQADGDGMFPIYLHAAALPPEERPYDPEHLVGTCDSRRSIRYPEAFDRLGPPLLTSGGWSPNLTKIQLCKRAEHKTIITGFIQSFINIKQHIMS